MNPAASVLYPSSRSALDNHRVNSANLFRRRIDPVQTFHHRLFMRSRNTQPTQIPAQLARTRMDHASEKFFRISDFKWQINSVDSFRRERGV